TGQTHIQGGTVILVGGNAIGDTSLVTLANGRDTTLQLTADETIGRLQGGRRNTNSDYGTVAIGDHTLTLNQSATTTFAGVFTGTGTIVMNAGSVGNLSMTGISTGFTGTVVVNGGLFQLSGASRNNAGSFTINKGGSLLIDKNGTSRIATQILDTAAIILNSADGGFSGTTINRPRGLGIRTDQESLNTEVVGVVTVNSGANYVTLEATTANDDLDLQMANLARNTGATLNVRGTNLGVATSNVQRSQFEISDSTNQTAFIAAMVGGGGAAGSPNVNIVPWAIGESFSGALTDTNMGNSLVTYVAGAGFRPLSFTTEYAGFATPGDANNTRESLTADLTGLAGRTVNSLVLHNDSTAAATHNLTGSGAGQTLTVTSGAMLFTLNPSAAAGSYGIHLGGFDGGIAVGGTNEYVIHVVDPDAATPAKALTATISSPLNTAGASLTKAGRGTLVLTADNTYGGTTYIAEGTLQIGSGGTTGSLAGTSSISNLGTLVFHRSDTLTQGVHFGTAISGTGSLWQMGSGTTVLNGNNTSTGATVIDQGVLRLDSAYHPSGALLLGSANGLTTAGSLEVNEGATFGSLLVQTNSASKTNQIQIAAGKELVIQGNAILGSTVGSSTTLLNVSGPGAWRIINPNAGATVSLGNTAVNRSRIDSSGLDTLEISLNTTNGLLRIGSSTSDSSTAYSSWWALAKETTITAATLTLGAGALGSLNELRLGTGSNVIHVNTFNVGTGSRDTGNVFFQGATGTLVVRAADGVGAATFNLGASGATTGNANYGNDFDVTGHDVDLLFGAAAIGTQNRGNSISHTFSFDQGTLTMASLTLATRTASSSNGLTSARITNSTVNLGGGTVVIQSGILNMGRAAGNYYNVGDTNYQPAPTMNATINITGGDVSIGATGGVAVRMAEYVATGGSGTGTANGHLNITGGSVTVGGNVIRVTDGVNATAIVTLNGGSLNMTGNSIGASATAVTFNAQSGTLANLGELNGGGSLTKTTAGTLILEGVNTYTGPTAVNAGTLLVHGTHTGGGMYTVQSGATLGGTGTTTAAVALSGVLSPGASVGMLATGSQTWNAGAGFLFEINDAAGTAGGPTGWDLAAITGTLDISALTSAEPFVVEIVSLDGLAAGDIANFIATQPDTWEFVTFDSLIGEFSSDLFTVEHAGFSNNLGQGYFEVVQTANGLAIGFVPEPGTLMLALAGMAVMLAAGRRRRGV
ncbi:MAG: autotransporter-associated beta strand repeat-containing protein, partial [Patescibacteria group bacterium]|nr:autotransporter-associated beta strand repeat-containing protein [Patescibacteria group bacterium]